MKRSIVDQVAGGLVQVITALATLGILVLDKGLGKFAETLPWHFYAMMAFIALGGKAKDIQEVLLRVLKNKTK